MSELEQLISAVRARTEGTPYVLTETPAGFDVHIDIEDASWFALYSGQHLSRAWVYHVKVEDGPKALSITDESRDLQWRAGAGGGGGDLRPVLAVSKSGARGRFEEKSFRKTWAIGEDGKPDEVVDYRFTAAEGRDLIRGPARELGWSEQRGNAEKVGLYVAVATVVLLALAAAAVGVVALAGGFS